MSTGSRKGHTSVQCFLLEISRRICPQYLSAGESLTLRRLLELAVRSSGRRSRGGGSCLARLGRVSSPDASLCRRFMSASLAVRPLMVAAVGTCTGGAASRRICSTSLGRRRSKMRSSGSAPLVTTSDVAALYRRQLEKTRRTSDTKCLADAYALLSSFLFTVPMLCVQRGGAVMSEGDARRGEARRGKASRAVWPPMRTKVHWGLHDVKVVWQPQRNRVHGLLEPHARLVVQ